MTLHFLHVNVYMCEGVYIVMCKAFLDWAWAPLVFLGVFLYGSPPHQPCVLLSE